jgi:hypothetical protein
LYSRCFALQSNTPLDGVTPWPTKYHRSFLPVARSVKCFQRNLKTGDAGLSNTRKLFKAESLLFAFPAPASSLPKEL